MQWVAWFMRLMQGCGTRCMGAWGPSPLYSSRLMPSRHNWRWLRLRWCTCGWGTPHHSPTTGSAPAAPVAAAPPLPGPWALHMSSPFLTWIWWWTSPPWERQCGHVSNYVFVFIYLFISTWYPYYALLLMAVAVAVIRAVAEAIRPLRSFIIKIYICML
jgi:hypothetical protein